MSELPWVTKGDILGLVVGCVGLLLLWVWWQLKGKHQ